MWEVFYKSNNASKECLILDSDDNKGSALIKAVLILSGIIYD